MKIKNIIKSCFLATIVFTWAACGGGGGVDCAKDPTNAQCPLDCVKNPTDTRCPKVTVTPITATISNIVSGTTQVICKVANPVITLNITSATSAADFTAKYPSNITATVTAVPTLVPNDPTLTVPLTITSNSITQAIPVTPSGGATSLRAGEIYNFTIDFVDVKNPTNKTSLSGYSIVWE